MDEKDKHINQKPDSNYPEPGVPAGNAWANMNDMLNQEMPLPETATPGEYGWIQSLKFITPIVIVLTVSLIFWNYGLDKKNVSTDHIKLNNIFSSTNSKEKSGKKEIESVIEKNNNSINDSSFQKIKTDSETVNPVSSSSKSETANASEAINHRFEKSLSDLNNGNKILDKTKNIKLNDNKKSVFSDSKDIAVLEKPVKIKAQKQRFDNNHVIEKSALYQTKNSKIKTRRNISNQQNKYTDYSVNKSLLNERISSVRFNNDLLEKSSKIKITTALLATRSWKLNNQLKQKFEAITIKEPALKVLPQNQKSKILNNLSKNIHAGLQWNANLPMKGYDQFFTGANNKPNQFYTLLIPGIWIEKRLNNGNGIMLKLNPYSQYFGNNKEITHSTTTSSDSLGITKMTNSTSLVKISGMSGGLQYNRHIYDKLSVGIGANVYWQNRALLNNIVSDSVKTIMSDSLYSVKETSNEGKYLNLYFVTANLEVLYTWRMLQFGGGIVVPVTSMTGISDKKIRPVSGQLVFRWRLK